LIRVVCREVKTLMFLTRQKENHFTVKLLDVFLGRQSDIEDPESISKIYLVTNYMPLTL